MGRKINIDWINRMIADTKSAGYELKMQDLLYILSSGIIEEKEIVYTALYGKGHDKDEIKRYDSDGRMSFLKKYVSEHMPQDDGLEYGDEGIDDISFNENKAYMLRLKKQTEDGIASGKIKQDKGIEILSKLSIALNDKFAVSEKQEEQRVVVYKKYNDICRCGREIYRPTRDDIMEDLKKEYDLIPKKKDGNG